MTLKRNKLKILLFCGIFFILLLVQNNSIDKTTTLENNRPLEKIAGIEGVLFYIDDTEENYTWVDFKTENPWCIGSGIENDPYRIENITLDVGGTGANLVIQNSDAHFIIRNCTFLNAGGYDIYRHSLEIYNTRNGKILNNTFENANEKGINIGSSYDIFIEDNVFKDNAYGINIMQNTNHPERITIGNNIFINQDYYGAFIFSVINLTIFQNKFISNGFMGISIQNCQNVNFTKNEIEDSTSYYGIQLTSSYNCLIVDNKIENSASHGVDISYRCDYLTLINNSIIHNGGDEIHFEGTSTCNFALLENNNASYNNGMGVYAKNVDYSNVRNNTIHHNGNYGIYLTTGACYNNLTNNCISFISGTGYGISVHSSSSYNNIKNNEIFNNSRGIVIQGAGTGTKSINNTIENNTCSKNIHGIYLKYADYTKISNNRLSSNLLYGIYSEYNSYGKVIGNNISKTYQESYIGNAIVLDQGSSHFIIRHNILEDNAGHGILIYRNSNYNTVLYNQINRNYDAICIYTSSYAQVIGNNMTLSIDEGLIIGGSDASNPTGNLIKGNNISWNGGDGISIKYRSSSNQFIDNVISYNEGNGIWTYMSSSYSHDYNDYIGNKINDNALDGIYLIYCRYTNIIRNNISGNTNGIFIASEAPSLIITRNIIEKNINYGIYVESGTHSGSKIYRNYFFSNTVNAYASGTLTWYDDGLGNYWDDYLGDDNNFDGIGDTPYSPGSFTDNYPIVGDPLFNGSVIYINGQLDGGYHSWQWISTRDWCDGKGTLVSPYIIQNLEINGSMDLYCIHIEDSEVYFRIENIFLYNASQYGIFLNNVSNGEIGQNALVNCSLAGIMLYGSEDIDLYDNYLTNNYYGMYIDTCNSSYISENDVIQNTYGIFMFGCKNNTLYHNQIFMQEQYAILLVYCDNNTLNSNNISSNYFFGLTLAWTNNSRIISNTLVNNSDWGFYLLNASYNKAYSNLFMNHTYGVFLNGSNYNTFSDNDFNGNIYHAYDQWGNGNHWNNSVIGNFWEGFISTDLDDDLIADSYYIFPTGIDYLPKYDDDEDVAPIILFNSPINLTVHGYSAPNYDITIIEEHLVAKWYSLDGGNTVFNITDLWGQIDQDAWAFFGNGTVDIVFYANDTKGYIGEYKITLRKDIIKPIITFESPIKNDVFGASSYPFIDWTFDEPNLRNAFLYLTNGTITTSDIFLVWEGAVNLDNFSASGGYWNPFSNGTIYVVIHAIDYADNEMYTNITIQKDIVGPFINIFDPSPMQLAGKNAPAFSLDVRDAHLNYTWYVLEGIGEKVFLSDFDGYIDSDQWKLFGNETVTITFYANDSLGNLEYKAITVRKDIINPEIIVFSPILGQEYSSYSPMYKISANEKINRYWYSLNHGITNTSILTTQGTIDPKLWEQLDSGEVNLTFYAEDLAGNVGKCAITLRKTAIETAFSPLLLVTTIILGIISIGSAIGILYLLKATKSLKKELLLTKKTKIPYKKALKER